jgi:hypothetical protein
MYRAAFWCRFVRLSDALLVNSHPAGAAKCECHTSLNPCFLEKLLTMTSASSLLSSDFYQLRISSTMRVETARENDQECTRGLHKSAGRARAFMEN